MYVLPLEKAAAPFDEVLRYLGWDGQQMDEQLLNKIKACTELTENTAAAKCVYSVFPIAARSDGVELISSDLFLPGRDICRLLDGCTEAVIFALTLSGGIDSMIRLNQQLDSTAAVIINSAANALVEQYCDNAQQQICGLLKASGSTRRFSCGYGDLPLGVQPDILKVLNAQRLIGVTALPSSLMLPEKTVTAVFGIGCPTNDEQTQKCSACHKTNCVFRRA